jgi:hypothetical protein
MYECAAIVLKLFRNVYLDIIKVVLVAQTSCVLSWKRSHRRKKSGIVHM